MEAERLAREAVAWCEKSDGLDQIGTSYEAHAEVLDLAGRRDEAVAACERALELYEQKGHEPYAKRAVPRSQLRS